jgi:hypothetical protein
VFASSDTAASTLRAIAPQFRVRAELAVGGNPTENAGQIGHILRSKQHAVDPIGNQVLNVRKSWGDGGAFHCHVL